MAPERHPQRLTVAIDTNVVLRFLLRDDERQAESAAARMQQGAFVSLSVLLEIVWVLRSPFGMSNREIAQTLLELVNLPQVFVADFASTRWALEARDFDVFATFDRDIARKAGPNAPVRIETMR